MTRQLHILLRSPDEFVEQILVAVQQQPGLAVEVVDLTQPEPDYDALVQRVFAADSVATW
jgi:hypothetical protein